jgi:hypothetical protein
MRAIAVAVSFLFVLMLMPKVVVGQTSIAEAAPPDSERGERERLSLQVAAGPTLTLVGGGHVVSAAFGDSPVSRLERARSAARRVSLMGDARCLLALEGYDGVIGIWPVRRHRVALLKRNSQDCGLACHDEVAKSVAGRGRSCRSDQEPSLTIRSVVGTQPVTNG